MIHWERLRVHRALIVLRVEKPTVTSSADIPSWEVLTALQKVYMMEIPWGSMCIHNFVDMPVWQGGVYVSVSLHIQNKPTMYANLRSSPRVSHLRVLRATHEHDFDGAPDLNHEKSSLQRAERKVGSVVSMGGKDGVYNSGFCDLAKVDDGAYVEGIADGE